MKKYINIIMVLMFASMACDVEDELVSALTPEVNSAYVGTWKESHKQNNSAADCSGTWSDDANFTANSELGFTLSADGVMATLDGSMSVPYSSSGTTGTYMGQDILTFEEQTDGTWVMWMQMAGTDADDNPLSCYRVGYTMQ